MFFKVFVPTDSNGRASNRIRSNSLFILENSPGPPYQFIHRHGIRFGLIEVFACLDVVGFLAVFLFSLLANDILFQPQGNTRSPQVSGRCLANPARW